MYYEGYEWTDLWEVILKRGLIMVCFDAEVTTTYTCGEEKTNLCLSLSRQTWEERMLALIPGLMMPDYSYLYPTDSGFIFVPWPHNKLDAWLESLTYSFAYH